MPFKKGNVPWNIGRKRSNKTKEKISRTKMGSIPWNKGKKGVMPEPWNKGKTTPKEVKEKQRQAKLKNPVRYWLGKKRLHMTDEKHWMWKGDDAGYRAKHQWIEKMKGKACMCEDCGVRGLNRYHWHNLDKKYTRELNKYKQLCPTCHKNKQHHLHRW